MGPDNLKILTVCKDDETLELLAKAVCLKYPKSRLFFAKTVEECLQKHEQNQPDILILVLDDSVFEFVGLVSKVLLIYPHCSVLLISHYSSGESISRCVKLGVKDVLITPLNYELFLRKLAAIIMLHGDKTIS